MHDADAPPTARRRRPRIPATIARQRMLDAGVALVERQGLTVGFDHLPLEEIIADAGVSHASGPLRSCFFGSCFLLLLLLSYLYSLRPTALTYSSVFFSLNFIMYLRKRSQFTSLNYFK